MKIKEMKYEKEGKIELLYKDVYKNYKYYILNLGTHPTAYIEIPKDHKYYKKDYDRIDLNVHGGLTYSDNELMSVKSNSWFIGWDYAHYNDYCGFYEGTDIDTTNMKKWTTEEIIEDCKNAIDQIIDFESKEILKEKKIPSEIKSLNNVGNVQNIEEFADKQHLNNHILKDRLNEIIDYLKSKGE